MNKNREELLEEIWTMQEEGKTSSAELEKRANVESFRGELEEMCKLGLVKTDGESILLTDDGKTKAEEIIRRHRLAEVLLSAVLDVPEEDMESHACEFEHILSPSVTESVCAFLGHPSLCPHGKIIPSGRCCHIIKTELKPLVKPLNDLRLGEVAKIVFIAPRHHGRLNRLSTLGIVPGSSIRMRQKKPSLVFEIGETTIALDREVASMIFVKSI